MTASSTLFFIRPVERTATGWANLPVEAAYLYLRETKYIPYVPTGATIGAFRERLSGLVGSVLAGEFPSRPSYGCRWCDYRGICEGEIGT